MTCLISNISSCVFVSFFDLLFSLLDATFLLLCFILIFLFFIPYPTFLLSFFIPYFPLLLVVSFFSCFYFLSSFVPKIPWSTPSSYVPHLANFTFIYFELNFIYEINTLASNAFPFIKKINCS